MPDLNLSVRYYALRMARGKRCDEKTFRHATLNWRIPPQEAAVILVDCWDKHYIASHEERSRKITLDRIKPVLEACRTAGVTVVHAPSPPTAKHFPQWIRYAGEAEINGAGPTAAPAWPPQGFRQRQGKYAQFAKPKDPVLDEWLKTHERLIIPEIAPIEDDFVIATGAQLHRLLTHKQILHLFYAGFAANMCVPFRDYGMRAMKDRGYNIILLRDCTSAIEAHSTVADFQLTQDAIINTEMTVGHTCTSAELIKACCAAAKKAPSGKRRSAVRV